MRKKNQDINLNIKIKSIIRLIVIVCLLFFVALNINNRKDSSRIDKRLFHIEDTLNVNQVILSNRNLDTITIKRNHNQDTWILNNDATANPSAINLLLKTMKEMRIKNPISRAALDNIITRMAIQNTKVEIFYKNRLERIIFIGGETQDQLGTYMMLEGATEPYVIYIPGFNGYLSSRFSCNEVFWRNRNIFNKKRLDLDIAYYNNKDINKQCEIEASALHNIHCESFITDNNDFHAEEILQRDPFISISLKDQESNNQIFYGFRKKAVNKEKYKQHTYDRERFYGAWVGLGDDTPLMLIQYNQFHTLVTNTTCNTDSIFRPWNYININ